MSFWGIQFIKRLFSNSIISKSQSATFKTLPVVSTENGNSKGESKRYPSETWNNIHEFLVDQGFSEEKFSYIMAHNPKLLKKTPEVLHKSIECWRSFQFGERNVISLLENYPELIGIQNSVELNNRFDALKKYVNNDKNVFKVLLNSPNVAFDNVNLIEKKVNYLKNTMKVDQSEATKSKVFSVSLEVLEQRHVFLERLGLYDAKNSKREDHQEPSKNPNLYQIVDTSDKRFATKVAFVTLDEFETFIDLYKKEKKNFLDFESDDEHYDEHRKI